MRWELRTGAQAETGSHTKRQRGTRALSFNLLTLQMTKLRFKLGRGWGEVTCFESHRKLVAARTQFRSTPHESLFQAPSPSPGDRSLVRGQGDGRWERAGQGQETCCRGTGSGGWGTSCCSLLTLRVDHKSDSFLASERPPRPPGRGLTKVPGQLSVCEDRHMSFCCPNSFLEDSLQGFHSGGYWVLVGSGVGAPALFPQTEARAQT